MFNRIREPELMDDPEIARHSHIEALNDLASVNRLTRVARRIWRPICRAYETNGRKPLRVLDLATGSGDTPIALWETARRKGVEIQFAGSDLSPTCIEHARRQAERKNAAVDFFKLDVLKDEIPEGFDIIMCVQFMHHLDPPDIIAVLKKMSESASHGVIVNDLIRSYTGLGIVWLATRILSNSEIIRFDGPASIRAAFTMKEWEEFANKAGLGNYSIRPSFPCHMLLESVKGRSVE